METRFRSLRIIGTIFKVFAWIALVGGILAGLGIIVMGLAGGFASAPELGDAGAIATAFGVFGGVFGGFTVIVGSLLYFLGLYATGDAIYLALAIEQNTRETAYYLKGGDIYRPQS